MGYFNKKDVGSIGILGFGGTALAKEQQRAARADTLDPVDGKYKEMVGKQAEYANQFRSRLPAYQKEAADIGADRGKFELARQLAGTRSNLSGRGMLYGGVGQGMQARDQSKLASGLASQRNQINVQSEEAAREMELEALQRAMELRQMEQDINDANYNAQMDANQRSTGMVRGVLSGVGGLLGGIGGGLGGKK